MGERTEGGIVELGHVNKHFKNMSKTQENMPKIQQKEVPQENILKIFLPDTLRTTF